MKIKKYRKNKISRRKKEQIEKRYKLLLLLIIILMSTLIGYLFYIQIIKNEFFKEKVEEATVKIVEGDSAPRGRIYDRNGRLIVNNIAVKVITYKKNGLNTKQEIELAYKLANMLEIDYKRITEQDKIVKETK